MDNDFEIEVYEEENATGDVLQLPVNFIMSGIVENDDLKVYIRQEVYSALEKYSRVDTAHERGTILIGYYGASNGKTHVVISDYIEAKYTDATASTLTFTHETWEYINKEFEKKYSDKKIIGWQHTHPNYGIFLSNYDVFIHENFFDQPFQVAYVIDPVQDLRGFFQWKNGKIEKLKGFYVYDDLNKKINIQPEKKDDNMISAPKVKGHFVNIIICLLTISVCLLAGYTIVQNRHFMQKYSEQEKLILELKDCITTPSTESTTMREEAQTSLPSKNTEETANIISFINYTVEKGDSLYKICEKLHINLENNYSVIVAMNGLNDSDIIYEGQTLILPID